MIRVSAVSEFERFTLVDKNGVERKLKMFVKNNNIYLYKYYLAGCSCSFIYTIKR